MPNKFLTANVFIIAVLVSANCAKALEGAPPRERNNVTSEVYRATYYWTVHPEDADLSSAKMDVIHKNGSLIGKAPRDLIKRIALEGSGFLEDGKLLNIGCNCRYPNVKFVIIDTTNNQYGLDARGKALVPFKSIAVDRRKIRLSSTIYIKKFKGKRMPDGSIHDGCFVAADVGAAIREKRIDIFSGRKSHYKIIARMIGTDQLNLQINSSHCG